MAQPSKNKKSLLLNREQNIINDKGKDTKMARKIKGNSTLNSLMKRAGISKNALKSASGRAVRKDVKISTLRKKSK